VTPVPKRAPRIEPKPDSDFDCRFRRPHIEGTSWRKGRLAYREELDTYVGIADVLTGGIHTIPIEFVQIKVPRPRKGWKWEQMK